MLQQLQDEKDLRGRAGDSIPQIGRRRGDGSEDETRGVARSGGSGGGECFVVLGFLYRVERLQGGVALLQLGTRKVS
jgi:hypothetical protein